MKMNIMFDEQQAMTMALNISGNQCDVPRLEGEPCI